VAPMCPRRQPVHSVDSASSSGVARVPAQVGRAIPLDAACRHRRAWGRRPQVAGSAGAALTCISPRVPGGRRATSPPAHGGVACRGFYREPPQDADGRSSMASAAARGDDQRTRPQFSGQTAVRGRSDSHQPGQGGSGYIERPIDLALSGISPLWITGVTDRC